MASEYWDIVSFRDRGEGNKPFAVKLGSAKKRDDGSFDLYFDALPAPSLDRNGKMQIHVRVSPRQERGQGGGGYAPRNQQTSQRQGRDNIEDELPPW
jgi:hypothetical protein